ncbi:sunset domain-containing protein [Pontibacillus salipaludis]|nr:hypothetical protein [Pontibacillus salipaludis]
MMRKFGVVLAYLAVIASGMMIALLLFTPSQRKGRIRSTPHTVEAPTIQTKPSHKETEETELVEFAEQEEFKSLVEKEELVEASLEQRDPFEETRESIRDEMRSVVEMSDIERSLNPQPIKGNQNSKGEKIYHMPGGQYYNRVKAIEVFNTPSEAEAAGYRKSRR